MRPEDELAALEDLIDQIVKGLQDAIQSGEVISDELQGQIAEELNLTADRITQLRQEIQQPQAPVEEAPQQEIEQQIQTQAQQKQEVGLGPPPSPEAQLLFILAGQNPEVFVRYLQEFPSPTTQALLRNPAELERNIEYLSRMMPQGEQPVIDGIQHADLNSSTIWGTKYDPKTGKMQVRFQGGDEYEYDGVPKNIYDAFSQGNASAKTTGSNKYGSWFVGKNPSLGAAMNQYIKQGGFPYRKLT